MALAALLFLYRDVLHIDLPYIDGVERAKRPQRLPVVFTRQEAAAQLHETPAGEELARLENEPACELSWWELNQLAQVAPERMLRRWEEVKDAARDELQSGQRVASAVLMPVQDSPMDRARYIAIRQELTREWNPRTGIEETLLDLMAQAWVMQLRWQEIATARMLLEHRTLTPDEVK